MEQPPPFSDCITSSLWSPLSVPAQSFEKQHLAGRMQWYVGSPCQIFCAYQECPKWVFFEPASSRITLNLNCKAAQISEIQYFKMKSRFEQCWERAGNPLIPIWSRKMMEVLKKYKDLHSVRVWNHAWSTVCSWWLQSWVITAVSTENQSNERRTVSSKHAYSNQKCHQEWGRQNQSPL